MAQQKQVSSNSKTPSQRLVTEQQLSEITGIAVRTYQRWRLLGSGPKYRKLGDCVRYDLSDVEEWIRSCPSGGGNQAA